MATIQQNQFYTQKHQNLLRRRELIRRLRRNAGLFQFFAFIFVVGGLGLDIWMKVSKFEDPLLTGIAIIALVLGIAFQISAVVYFSKAKKHLSGLTVNASTDPKNWV